jgi:hypothetical protein
VSELEKVFPLLPREQRPFYRALRDKIYEYLQTHNGEKMDDKIITGLTQVVNQVIEEFGF